MSSDDLIVAFYPCIYFCAMSQVAFNLGYVNYRKLNDCQKIEKIMKRSDDRKEYYDRLLKFVSVCLYRGLRMVFENPWAEQTYLKANFLKKPDVIDMDRTKRGDCRRKSTAYWFWNCEPTNGNTYEPYQGKTKAILHSKPSSKAGLCSEDRSMIMPAYAKNWIKDFVLGLSEEYKESDLFS